ncbi:hypothetical protein [Streptomyces sp. NPDC020965]|uniref:hypothetical protein n=1 Tax=Streptomyces sp. NPDC020965 TaxID=3365105 RepID=UPI00378BF629
MTDPAETKIDGTRSVETANKETKKVSSEIFDLIAMKGKIGGAGPGTGECGDDREKHFLMRHSWNVSGSTDAEVAQAMTRLKEGLPKQGWKIVSYERNNSPAKSLTLIADHDEKKFGVNVEFWEKGKARKDNPPGLVITVVSGCFQVPEGETVDHY